jgi:hypothetical protein
MQARYYDPVIGRFYSNDPVGFTGDITTFNRYSYVGNNPYKYTDPDGKQRDGYTPRGLTREQWQKIDGDAAVSAAANVGVTVVGGAVLNAAARGLQAIRGVGGTVNGSVWKLKPFERGVQIEKSLGHNLPNNFPVIDKFVNGVATSIKSLDLNAKSYQSIATLNRTVTKYIDKVANFNGRTWAGVSVKGRDITGRSLDLAVPSGGSSAQNAALNQLVKYGQSQGVNVNIVRF